MSSQYLSQRVLEQIGSKKYQELVPDNKYRWYAEPHFQSLFRLPFWVPNELISVGPAGRESSSIPFPVDAVGDPNPISPNEGIRFYSGQIIRMARALEIDVAKSDTKSKVEIWSKLYADIPATISFPVLQELDKLTVPSGKIQHLSRPAEERLRTCIGCELKILNISLLTLHCHPSLDREHADTLTPWTAYFSDWLWGGLHCGKFYLSSASTFISLMTWLLLGLFSCSFGKAWQNT